MAEVCLQLRGQGARSSGQGAGGRERWARGRAWLARASSSFFSRSMSEKVHPGERLVIKSCVIEEVLPILGALPDPARRGAGSPWLGGAGRGATFCLRPCTLSHTNSVSGHTTHRACQDTAPAV